MKVTQDHFDLISNAIAPLDTDELRAKYRAGDYPRSELTKDLDKRYRWDLFWAAWDAAGRPAAWALDYGDAHLDTALRRIVPALTKTAEVAR